jgi:hypothetical protein
MHIYFLFWLNLLVGSNLIRKFNELQYSQNFSERNQKLFENSCISFPYQLKVIMEQALFFLNLKLSNLKALSVALIGINFCLLISLYLGRIVCLNLTLVKIKTYNFPLLSILYHRWAEIEHMTRIKIIILSSSTLVRKWQHHNKL